MPDARGVDVLRRLGGLLHDDWPGLLPALQADPRVHGALLGGSRARGSNDRTSDLDLLLLLDHPAADGVEGVHLFDAGRIEVDLIFISATDCHEQRVDEYVTSCLLVDATALWWRCDQCQYACALGLSRALTPELKRRVTGPMSATQDELAHLVWHLKHTAAKAQAASQGSTTRAVMVCKLVYFSALLSPRIKGLPVLGEKAAIATLAKDGTVGRDALLERIDALLRAPPAAVTDGDIQALADTFAALTGLASRWWWPEARSVIRPYQPPGLRQTDAMQLLSSLVASWLRDRCPPQR